MSSRLSKIGLCAATAMIGLLSYEAIGRIADRLTPSGWLQHDIKRPKPPVVEPGASPGAPPRDAIVLFDGTSLNEWESADRQPAGWLITDDAMVVAPGKGAIHTKRAFGDVQLHIEWASPNPPVGKGQDRGNSGIFLQNQFEIQVIDSYQAETYADGQAGAIYGQYPPLFNATRPPGEWQTYDIAFRRPRYDESGALLEKARITVFLNGVLVQNNEEPWGLTNWLEPSPYDSKVDRAPIELQDHGHPVRFRNVWVRDLPERPSPPAGYEDQRRTTLKLSAADLDKYAGSYQATPEHGGMELKLFRQGEQLMLKLAFRPTPLLLNPRTETEFVLPRTDGVFTFSKDAEGKITGATFRIGDGERVLKKIGD